GAGGPTGIPHLESKRQIEKYARSLRIPATFLRPVFYMDNFNVAAWGYQGAVLEGRLDLPLVADKKLSMVAVDDIGHFTALAFERPGDFIGAAFEVASEELSMIEIADVFSRVMGRPVRFVGGPERIAEVRKYSEE